MRHPEIEKSVDLTTLAIGTIALLATVTLYGMIGWAISHVWGTLSHVMS